MNDKDTINQYIQIIKWGGSKDINAELLLRITSLCNMRCRYCFAARKFEKISAERLIALMLKRLSEEGIGLNSGILITITGGEPLLREDLIELLRGLKRILGNYKINIQTNATLINRDMAKKLLQSNVRSAFIGFPSINRKNYYLLTGVKNGYEQAIRGVNSLIEAKIDVCLNFILHKMTIEEFEDIPSFIVNNFGKSVSVNLSTLSPGTPMEFLREYGIPYSEAGKILQRAYFGLKERGIRYGSFGGDCSPPICAFEGMEIKDIFSFGSSPLQIKYVNEFTNIEDGYRYKLISCRRCKYNSKCSGIPFGYAILFKRHNFRL
ncbi:MAG: radical SAM protein [Myxococcota bacterium]